MKKTVLFISYLQILAGTLGFTQTRTPAASIMMNEVMVVAYGSANRFSYAGSAVTLQGTQLFKDAPILSFEQILQGAVAGLNVNPTSGQPGAVWNLRIRGTGSMNASQEPLYVVDGVPVISGNIAASAISTDTKAFNIMVSLRPGDIDKITILKDAAAASLYGSRAANGVILITTKQGIPGRTSYRFKADWGIQDWAVKNKQTLSGEQQRELTYEAYYNEGILYNKLSESEAATYALKNADLYAPLQEEYSDWEAALFRRRGIRQNYELTASGGKGKNLFYLALGYNREKGMAENAELHGFTGRLNIKHQLSERLNLGANIALSQQYAGVVQENNVEVNPWYMIHYAYKPNFPIYNEDGSWFQDFPGASVVTNLVKDQHLDKNTSDVFRSSTLVWATCSLATGLTLKQVINYDFILNESTLWWPPSSVNGKPTQGVMVKISQPLRNIYSSTTFNYSRLFDHNHFIDILAGWDIDDRTRKYLQAKGTNYPGDRLPELENAADPGTAASGRTDDRLLSFLSRFNYNYVEKYYLSVNYRRDGSSRLGTDVRWGNFWSVAGAWRLRQEAFMSNADVLDELKIRLSYGVNGTLPRAEYGHLGLMKYGTNYQQMPGFAPVSFGNPNLSWEKNHSFNIGLDLQMWERFSATIDLYSRRTEGLIQTVPVSMVTGLQTTLKNIGAMRNRGIELSMNIVAGRDNRLMWITGIVLSHNRSKIVRLYGGRDIITGSRIWREGESYYAYWSREWAGVDTETGEEMWVKNTPNEDGTVDRSLTRNGNEAEKTVVGDAEPRLTGGWSNQLSWKGFRLSALFSFSLGGHVMDDLWTYTESDGYFAFNTIGVKQWARWQKPGDKTDVPRRINRYLYGRHGSTRHLISTDHLRLKNLVISWTIPGQWQKTARINGIRIYAAGTNLLTWSKYDDLDPEQPVEGFTTFAFPSVKTYTFGLEITL